MNIFSKTLILTVFLAIVMSPGISFCNESAGIPLCLQEVDVRLDLGDNQGAWEQLLQPCIPADSVGVLWRKARAQYEMGRLDDNSSQGNALGYFKKAEEYARTAITRDPACSDGYKWLAIALGAQTKHSKTQTRVRLSREIKENIEKAIALNPEDDIAYLVLSRWHYKVAGLGVVARTFAKIIYGGIPEASLGEAEKLLLHAIALHDRITHRYNLAKVYDRMERYEDKEIQLRKALLLPVTFPEEAEELEKAREKLR